MMSMENVAMSLSSQEEFIMIHLGFIKDDEDNYDDIVTSLNPL